MVKSLTWRAFQIAVLFGSAGALFTIGLESMVLVYGLAVLASFAATIVVGRIIDWCVRSFGQPDMRAE